MTCTLFMTREHEVEMLGVVNGVEHGKNGTPWVTKDVLYAMAKHHLVEYLSPRHANE